MKTLSDFMSIKNREDANKYYGIINELVDEYIDKWKIRPSRLRKYLKPGSDRYNRFLVRNNLSEIKGIERVFNDVIDDRYHMEKDGIITFESFIFNESNEHDFSSLEECFYNGIEKATIDYEKMVADYFDTNLGDIDVIDSDKHLFKINSWGKENVEVIIYSKDDMSLIKSNTIDFLLTEIKKKSIEISNGIKIELSNIIDTSGFEQKIENILNKDKMIELISKHLNLEYKGDINNYFIWKKN